MRMTARSKECGEKVRFGCGPPSSNCWIVKNDSYIKTSRLRLPYSRLLLCETVTKVYYIPVFEEVEYQGSLSEVHQATFVN